MDLTDNLSDYIQVTIRTRAAGHETVALPLDALPAFIDRHVAGGRIVIAESGDDSLVVRVGRQILDFLLGRRKSAMEAGRERPKEEVTVLNQMAGGSGDEELDPDAAETMGQVLAIAASAQARPQQEVAMAPAMPAMYAPRSTTSRPLDPMAEMRAWRALIDKEGTAAVQPLLHGGAIGVQSALWPNVLYLVSTAGIAVLHEGRIQARLCLMLADGAPIWDAVANRLQLLRAGREGEIEVWATANVVG